jgi:hypothetical protein
MRRIILGTVVALLGAGCSTPPSFSDDVVAPAISIEPSASPFSKITAGEVQAMVPDGWRALPAAPVGDARGGFMASPRPEAWRRMDGSIAGMSATWVDATRIGVPSDFYYLAATGPLLTYLTDSARCEADRPEVYVDNRPRFGPAQALRTGDYMARGEGTCNVNGSATRWAYFVAAPGFGPVRRVGIPSSGLYVVVAVMPDSLSADTMLHRLIEHTSFGGASVQEFTRAVSAGRG